MRQLSHKIAAPMEVFGPFFLESLTGTLMIPSLEQLSTLLPQRIELESAGLANDRSQRA